MQTRYLRLDILTVSLSWAEQLFAAPKTFVTFIHRVYARRISNHILLYYVPEFWLIHSQKKLTSKQTRSFFVIFLMSPFVFSERMIFKFVIKNTLWPSAKYLFSPFLNLKGNTSPKRLFIKGSRKKTSWLRKKWRIYVLSGWMGKQGEPEPKKANKRTQVLRVYHNKQMIINQQSSG